MIRRKDKNIKDKRKELSSLYAITNCKKSNYLVLIDKVNIIYRTQK
jgi:hypothetical protein